MYKPTMQQLEELTNQRDDRCFSLYMPTQVSTREVKQNPIRFKNLLSVAKQKLEDAGLNPAEREEFLEPGRRLVSDDSFWQHQSRGLSAFLSSEGLLTFKLPFAVDESLVIDDHFHVKQLLPLHSRNGVFYMLELGLHHVRLYQAGKYSFHEIHLHDVPESIEEALKFDDSQSQLHSHTRRPERQGAMNAVFHGHGVGIDGRKDGIHRFFLEVERRISAVLADSRSPLVLVGLDFLQPLYREVNSYQYLLPKGVTHNSEKGARPETLHAEAWKMVEPEIDNSMREARDLFNELADTERTETRIEEIAGASLNDRVETLFINPHEERIGRANRDTLDGEEDLVDLAAVQTIRHGGTVYTVDSNDAVPGPSVAAAIYRY